MSGSSVIVNSSPTAPARWRAVVGTLALTEVVSWGILYYAFGVLVSPMQAELGWSQGMLGGAFSLALFVAALLAVPVGRWLERHGPRGVMTAGSCAGVLLVLAWSEVAHPLVFYALFVTLGFPLASVLYEAAFAAVVGFLGRGRRTDLSLLFLTIVAGLANTVFVPLTQWLVDGHGWRVALRSLAVVLGVITIPLHALVLRGVPGRSAKGLDREVLPAGPAPEPPRSRLYLSATAFALATVAGTALGVYLLPILIEQGFDPSFAATVVSLTGIAQAIGRPLFTWLRPRYSLAFWSAALFLPFAAGVGVLALAPTRAVVIAGVCVLAMTSGSLTLARTVWTLELFPVTSFARVNGVLGLWSLIGRAGAPLAMGLGHDLFHSHRPGLVALASACVAGGACAWLAARVGRGRGSRELRR
jgi:MFS family permease